ncbi:acetyltransferase [Sutcliffiella rhizosphaerae]|uniref:UDP-N-acetylbacillosamine N-acetyltransferase n=1 Tax=Sutcliffiella rhizosphaerae TaxID=2880967 RepID=A0ABN8A510_9BACI|nr:acetyltransferase [Sutcliffiella rhizosphaerae]CAG9620195.1 UDP-N-acetylbacillosamine N-acetyltransferase [Sutcliffiella rhizosphaerae]
MNKNLLIIGASGHGKVVADIALKIGKWDSISFLDDNKNKKISMGLNVIGNTTRFVDYIKEYDIFVGIGNNKIRREIYNTLKQIGASIPTLIHPNSVIGSDVKVGEGTVIMAGVIINCCTTIGKGCIINTGSTLDHDNELENFVHLSPGVHLAGSVKIGSDSWLGVGSVVKNNIEIVENTTLGAGAVVVKDINEAGVYIGIPARRVK